jgi:hypothetical protein
LILTFLEIAGYEMYKAYPRQMKKLIQLLHDQVLPKMPEGAKATVTRLKLFLEDTVGKQECIPMPTGKNLKRS